MAAARRPWAADLLHFWFDDLGPADWFGGGPAVDAACAKFAPAWRRMHRQPVARFLTDRATARAAILLFDQIPRNLFRGTPQAFASDGLARQVCHGALLRGWDAGLSRAGRQFLLMPLMHSESRADQRLSVRCFTALGDAKITAFARDHAGMVARFGRFPHRNAVLGRGSTPAERRAVEQGHAW